MLEQIIKVANKPKGQIHKGAYIQDNKLHITYEDVELRFPIFGMTAHCIGCPEGEKQVGLSG